MDRRTALKSIAASAGSLWLPGTVSAKPEFESDGPTWRFGWNENRASLEDFLRRTEHPYVSQVNQAIRGTGKGKKAFLHLALERAMGTKFVPHNQGAPDCFYAGTLVTMSDGAQKPIEKVVVGDMVVSHTGVARKVIDTIRKPYKGKLIKVQAHSSNLVCTPNHPFWTARGWVEAQSLKLTDTLFVTPQRGHSTATTFDLLDFLPDAEATDSKLRAKGSTKWVNRFVPLDADLAFVLGAYLAEGSKTKHSISFNLSRDEVAFANTLCDKIRVLFGVECTLPPGPSKPTVQIVSCDSGAVATLVTSLCPGTTYTKSTPKEIQTASKTVKKAFLLGWLEGDGCCNGRKGRKWGRRFALCGASVSLSLIQGMSRLLSSLGIRHSVTSQEPEGKAKAYKINVRSQAVFELYPEHRDEATKRHPQLKPFKFQPWGSPTKITKLSNISSASTTVYCLVVDEDHSFSANLLSVHNCVSHAAALGIDILTAVQIIMKRMPYRWVAESATEPIYAGSRVEIGGYTGLGGGSTGHWAAEWVSRYGNLLRKEYPGGHDYTTYDAKKAVALGRTGCPDSLEPTAKLHPVKKTAICTSYSDLCDLIYNGSPVIVCSNVGFGSGTLTRDSQGFLTRKRKPWYHAMLAGGFDNEYSRKGALIFNSWGATWIKGPTRGPQPAGTFWIDANTVDAMLRQGDSFAYSAYVGFPRTVVPPYILY